MNRVLRLLVISMMATGAANAFAQEDQRGPTNQRPDRSSTQAVVTTAATKAAQDLEEEDEDGKPWAVSANLSTAIGQGTFVNVEPDPAYTDDVEDPSNAYDRWNLAFSLSPSYDFGDYLSVSANVAWTQQMLAGGGINEPNELRFQDVGLDLSWPGYTFKTVPVSVDAGLSFSFPTSDTSQTASLIVGTSLGGSVSYKLFDTVTLSYNTSVGKDFHEYTSPVLDDEEIGAENSLWRAGGSERVGAGLLAIDGVNTEWAWSNGISASFPVWDELRFSAAYTFSTYWTYDVLRRDEFSSEYAEDGRGVGQSVMTSVTLSYPIPGVDGLSVSSGIRTSQQAKTDDNRSYNFPFWNVDGAAANASQIRASVRYTY